MRNPLRQVMPVYTPARLPDVASGALRALRGNGDVLATLSDDLRHRYGYAEALLLGSGTQALQIALSAALAETGGDIAALPAFGCYDLASAAIGSGCRVILYDLDPDTLAPDPPSLERALRCGAGAVVITPLFGVPVDWNQVRGIAAPYGARLIEDAAQAHGATWKGRPVGSEGDYAVLSFGRGKGWTSGGGGAVLSRTPLNVQPGRAKGDARRTAVLVAQSILATPGLYGLPASIPFLALGSTRYHSPQPVAAMTPFGAALLHESRAAADLEAAHRKRRAAAVLELLADTAAISPRAPVGGEAGYLRLPARLVHGLASFRHPASAVRLGAAASYPAPLSRLEALQDILLSPARTPGADQLVRELVTLPTHSRASISDLVTLIAEMPRRRTETHTVSSPSSKPHHASTD